MKKHASLLLEDDENYIYFDKDGNPTSMLELTLHWNGAPDTKSIVTCSQK